jgi:acyl dehydratase
MIEHTRYRCCPGRRARWRQLSGARRACVYRATGITRPSVMMGRNALDAFRQQIDGRRMADIAETEHAYHPFALVDHGQSADLQSLHVPHRLGEIVSCAGDRLASENNALELCIESNRVRCATGLAFMPSDRRGAPAVDALPVGKLPRERPEASESALAPGRALSIAPLTIDRVMLSIYLDEIRESVQIYRNERLVHPGQILRLANLALVQNVILGPWIHVGSKVRNHAVVHLGEELTLRSRITSNGVSKGHSIVEFNAIAIADRKRCVAEMTHVAIWRPRQVSGRASDMSVSPPMSD